MDNLTIRLFSMYNVSGFFLLIFSARTRVICSLIMIRVIHPLCIYSSNIYSYPSIYPW